MAIKFSFRDAIEGMTHVAAGTLAGKIQGIEMQQQQQQRAMQTAQMMQQQQHAQSQERLGYLKLVGDGKFQPAQSLTSSGIVPGISEQEPAIGASSPFPQAAAPPTYESPIGPLQQVQMSDRDLTEFRGRQAKIDQLLTKVDPNDPMYQTIQGERRKLSVTPKTPEELDQLNQLQSNLSGMLTGRLRSSEADKDRRVRQTREAFKEDYDAVLQMPPDVASDELVRLLGVHDDNAAMGIPKWLERDRKRILRIKELKEKGDDVSSAEAESIARYILDRSKSSTPVSAGAENQAERNFLERILPGFRAEDLAKPGFIRSKIDPRRLPHLAKWSDEDLLAWGKGIAHNEFIRRFDDFTTKMEKMPSAGRVIILGELGKLASISGDVLAFTPEQVRILASDTKAKKELEKLQAEATSAKLKAKALPEDIRLGHANIRNQIEYRNKQIDKLKKEGTKQSITASQEWDKYNAGTSKALTAYEKFISQIAPFLSEGFDPNNPNTSIPEELRASEAYDRYEQALEKEIKFMKKHGLGEYAPTKPAPPKKAITPTPKPKKRAPTLREHVEGLAIGLGKTLGIGRKSSPARRTPVLPKATNAEIQKMGPPRTTANKPSSKELQEVIIAMKRKGHNSAFIDRYIRNKGWK